MLNKLKEFYNNDKTTAYTVGVIVVLCLIGLAL